MGKTRKLNKRERVLLGVLVSILGVFLIGKMVYDTYNNLKALEAQITLNEKKLFKLKSILGKSKELNTAYEHVVSSYKGLRNSDNLLQEISNIARRLNVNILKIQPAMTADEAKFKTYAIKIESQDDISTFAKFLFVLTEELKSVGVERVQIEAQGKGELPLVKLMLNATAFKN
jgi:hypothetical protein